MQNWFSVTASSAAAARKTPALQERVAGAWAAAAERTKPVLEHISGAWAAAHGELVICSLVPIGAVVGVFVMVVNQSEKIEEARDPLTVGETIEGLDFWTDPRFWIFVVLLLLFAVATATYWIRRKAALKAKQKYQGVTTGLSWGMLAEWYLHLGRAMEDPAWGDLQLASKSEKACIKDASARSAEAAGVSKDVEDSVQKHFLDEDAARPILNYVVWRRSMLYLLISTSLILACLSFTDLYTLQGRISGDWHVSSEFTDFDTWEKHVSKEGRTLSGHDLAASPQSKYYLYTRDFIWFLSSEWVALRGTYEVVIDCVAGLTYLLICGLAVYAATIWASWKRSGLWLRAVWFLSFALPFLPTVIPFRAVVDVDTLASHADEFFERTLLHYKLTDDKVMKAEREFARVCGEMPVMAEEVRDTVRKQQTMLRRLCKVIEMVPAVNLGFIDTHALRDLEREICPRIDDVNADEIWEGFKSAHESCTKAIGYVEQMKRNTVYELSDLFAMVRNVITESVAAVASTGYAIVHVKQALPAALSVGPGLLKGALIAKQLVPEASTPGIFLILLPWLYVPMMWTLCNVIVQAVGDWLVAAVFFFLAFAPLGMSIVALQTNANNPMSSKGVQVMSTAMTVYSRACLLCAFVFFSWLGVVLWQERWDQFLAHQGLVQELMRERIMPVVLGMRLEPCSMFLGLLPVAANLAFKYMLTAMAATDWMLQETAMQRMFENLDRQHEHFSPAIREQLPELRKTRNRRMCALVIAQGGSDERPTGAFQSYLERFLGLTSHTRGVFRAASVHV